MKHKGYSYTVTTKQIIEYSRLSVRHKLQWLEAVNHLNFLALDKKTKKIQTLFRRAKI